MIRIVQLDRQQCAVFIINRLGRSVRKIIIRIRFLLPPVGVEILTEITLVIQQPAADQRKSKITGGFQMIARQNPQPPAVNRKTVSQTEFRGKIGYRHWIARLVFDFLRVGLLIPPRLAHVILEFVHYSLKMRNETFVLAGCLQFLLIDRSQQSDGIVIQLLPQLIVQPPEQIDRRRVPAPPDVMRQILQNFQTIRKKGGDGECFEHPHIISSFSMGFLLFYRTLF